MHMIIHIQFEIFSIGLLLCLYWLKGYPYLLGETVAVYFIRNIQQPAE